MKPMIPALFFALVSPVFATTFVPVPFSQTVKEADTIVRGRIGESHVDWSKTGGDGSKRIYTYYEIQVDEVVKGGIGNSKTVIMRQMGGEKDGVGMSIPGAAKFSPGEDVVVMLGAELSDQTHDLMGLMTGKLQVLRDEKGQEVLKGPAVSGDFGSEAVALHDDHGDPRDSGDPRREKVMTMEGLRAVVKETGGSGTGKVTSASTVSPSTAASATPAVVPAAPQAEAPPEVSAAETEDPWLARLKSPWGIGLIALFLVVHILRRLSARKP